MAAGQFSRGVLVIWFAARHVYLHGFAIKPNGFNELSCRWACRCLVGGGIAASFLVTGLMFFRLFQNVPPFFLQRGIDFESRISDLNLLVSPCAFSYSNSHGLAHMRFCARQNHI